MDASATKECRRCRITRDAADFSPEPRNRDGLHSYCRPCRAQIAFNNPRRKENTDRWFRENREKKLADNARWRRENADRMKELNARWRRENAEKAALTRAAYYQANREHHRELVKAWTKRNRDVVRSYRRARRARESGAVCAGFTAAQLAARWSYYGDKCWICRKPATATDHVKPLAKGGAHMLSNLRPICTSCNCSKRDRWPL